MWQVRVQVRSIIRKALTTRQAGQEAHSVTVASDALKARPHWALAVIGSLRKSGWIAVEARSPKNVENLCRQISTIVWPFDARLMPLEERVDRLLAKVPEAKPTPPGWARIKPTSVLSSLDDRPPLLRYASDLALVTDCQHDPYLELLVIPRFLVKECISGEDGASLLQKRIRQRLLHPLTLPSMRQERIASNFAYDPDLFWSPTKESKLISTPRLRGLIVSLKQQ
jgi:hypothetical protein